MRKFILTIISILCFSLSYSQRYATTYTITRHDYYLDRKIEEVKQKSNAQWGVLTRFGYSYNDDAFMYGASVFYHFDGILGVSIGFDGYYIPHIYKQDENGEIYEESKKYSLPMWDMRGGFLLGKYFAFGALAGKCKICNTQTYHENRNLWGSKLGEGIYGGYITFILPLGKHFGLNMDFALTNHTGFNAALGINFHIPVK